MKKLFAIGVLAFLLASCTTIPARFNQNPQISENGGYVVSAETEKGFQLEAFYKSYSFTPSPDDNIQEAKNYFIATANEQSMLRKKKIQPIQASTLAANATRNMIDGVFSIYITAPVLYDLE